MIVRDRRLTSTKNRRRVSLQQYIIRHQERVPRVPTHLPRHLPPHKIAPKTNKQHPHHVTPQTIAPRKQLKLLCGAIPPPTHTPVFHRWRRCCMISRTPRRFLRSATSCTSTSTSTRRTTSATTVNRSPLSNELLLEPSPRRLYMTAAAASNVWL